VACIVINLTSSAVQRTDNSQQTCDANVADCPYPKHVQATLVRKVISINLSSSLTTSGTTNGLFYWHRTFSLRIPFPCTRLEITNPVLGTPNILHQICLGIPHSSQENSGRVLRIDDDCFFPNSFKLIFQQSSYYRGCVFWKGLQQRRKTNRKIVHSIRKFSWSAWTDWS